MHREGCSRIPAICLIVLGLLSSVKLEVAESRNLGKASGGYGGVARCPSGNRLVSPPTKRVGRGVRMIGALRAHVMQCGTRRWEQSSPVSDSLPPPSHPPSASVLLEITADVSQRKCGFTVRKCQYCGSYCLLGVKTRNQGSLKNFATPGHVIPSIRPFYFFHIR